MKKKALAIILIIIGVISVQICAYAHSGRTDSSGGHKDNKNKSGLGSYHYHCGGYPAHLHPNGVCPYSSSSTSSSSSQKSNSSSSSTQNSNSGSSSSTKSTSSTSKTTTNTEAKPTEPTVVDVTEIKINENVSKLKVGEKQKLTVTITPENATYKNTTWKSSAPDIATVDSMGEISAIKAGSVDIIVTSSNGKTDKITFEIDEEKIDMEDLKAENLTNEDIALISSVGGNSISKSDISDDGIEALVGVAGLGLIGGGTYLGYKKLKK